MANDKKIASYRYRFVDALRGLAIVLMVINHTARYWLSFHPNQLIYFTMIFSGPLFLFLVGFSLALSYRQKTERQYFNHFKIIKKYFWRAIGLMIIGYVLSLALYGPAEMFRGRVLQSIAWCIILLLPWLKWTRTAAGRISGLIFSLSWLFILPLFFAPLRSWVDGQPLIAYLFFSDYAPLYYFALPLLGLILGNWFLEFKQQPQKIISHLRIFLLAAAACFFIGINAVLRYADPVIGKNIFWRDFILNNYWLPRSDTLFLILGYIGLVGAAAYYLFEIKKIRFKAAEILGQASLMVYCLHLLLVYRFARILLGVSLSNRPVYWLLNILLIIILYVCARIWPDIKSKVIKLKK